MQAARVGDDNGALIRRILRSGDERAFRTLYRRHSNRLFALLRQLTGGSVTDAEDLLQETWLRAARRLRTLSAAEACAAWLRSIACNVAREWLRSQRRPWLIANDALAESAPDRAPAINEKLEVDALLHRLPPGCRAVLVLHDLHGHTHEEIADLLGIAPGTSKSQLSLARQILRRHSAAETEASDAPPEA